MALSSEISVHRKGRGLSMKGFLVSKMCVPGRVGSWSEGLLNEVFSQRWGRGRRVAY